MQGFLLHADCKCVRVAWCSWRQLAATLQSLARLCRTHFGAAHSPLRAQLCVDGHSRAHEHEYRAPYAMSMFGDYTKAESKRSTGPRRSAVAQGVRRSLHVPVKTWLHANVWLCYHEHCAETHSTGCPPCGTPGHACCTKPEIKKRANRLTFYARIGIGRNWRRGTTMRT